MPTLVHPCTFAIVHARARLQACERRRVRSAQMPTHVHILSHADASGSCVHLEACSLWLHARKRAVMCAGARARAQGRMSDTSVV
eukprot:4630958-Alexandrium_andersonii.AAC.1